MEFTDQTLVEEVQAGSSVAFEHLMRRYERLVFKVAYGYAGGREGALDVTQNVFLKVHHNLKAFRGKGAFKGWLMRITVHESLNWKRSQRRHQGHDELMDFHMTSEHGQDEMLVDQERRRMLLESMGQLNPKQRLAVALRYFEGMPVREISALLRCSEGVTKNILFRSLRKLRAELSMLMEVPS
ncbi:MAG: sigma-70 family RNA polymerase sigma factor [Acidobacteriota bacterium]